MSEYAGSAAAFQWIWSGGTVDLAQDHRSVNVAPSMETIDATAGSDANRQHLPSFVDYTVTSELVAQDGARGTILAQALKAGVSGTLVIGPYGTASNSLRYTIPAFSLGAAQAIPYADVVTLSAEWRVSSGGSVTVGFYA